MIWAIPVDVEENDMYELEKKSVAIITKVEGKAQIISNDNVKEHKAELGEALFEGDTLITSKETKVFIELNDNSKLILDENSKLVCVSNSRLKHLAGEVYYKIKTPKDLQGFYVETPFSIIRIKGTELIIDANGRGKIALNKGSADIESLNKNFELYEKNRAKEDHKEQLEAETITYVKSFDLNSGKVLNFSKADECKESCSLKVQEVETFEVFRKRFNTYEKMLKEIEEGQAY
jgi:hypothetical protein